MFARHSAPITKQKMLPYVYTRFFVCRHTGHSECSGFRVTRRCMKCCAAQRTVLRSALTPVRCSENSAYLPLNLHASASKGKNLIYLLSSQNISKLIPTNENINKKFRLFQSPQKPRLPSCFSNLNK